MNEKQPLRAAVALGAVTLILASVGVVMAAVDAAGKDMPALLTNAILDMAAACAVLTGASWMYARLVRHIEELADASRWIGYGLKEEDLNGGTPADVRRLQPRRPTGQP